MSKMNKDRYGEVINGERTYDDIAESLMENDAVLIGWTDEAKPVGTHFDILFTRKAVKEGTVQGGVRGGDLFVSIMRLGAFGFDIANKDTASGYYMEKLRFSGEETGEKLAELINEIKKRI